MTNNRINYFVHFLRLEPNWTPIGPWTNSERFINRLIMIPSHFLKAKSFLKMNLHQGYIGNKTLSP